MLDGVALFVQLLERCLHARAAELTDIELFAAPEGLALAPVPGTIPSLTEPGGSFGGLTTPANVALGPDSTIFL